MTRLSAAEVRSHVFVTLVRLEGAGHRGANLGAAGVVESGQRLIEALHRRRDGGDDARLRLAAKAVLQQLTG